MLRLQHLEDRVTPSTLADVLPRYTAGYDPIPGADPAHVQVTSAKLGTAAAAPVYDVFFATGQGMGARVVIRDTQTGATLADRIVFEESFRGGVESVAVIGTELFASPGETGGPVIAVLDLVTFGTRYLAAIGFPSDWRGGLRLAATDVDHVNGSESPDPREELLVLPGGSGGGPQLLILDPDTGGPRRPSFWVGDPAERSSWGFVPAAAAGTRLANGEMGLCVQQDGQPETTRSYTWSGGRVTVELFPGESATDAGAIVTPAGARSA